MKTILQTAIFLLVANSAIASGYPDVATIESDADKIWFCQDADCSQPESEYRKVKEDTLRNAQSYCVVAYGDLKNCVIHENTYDVVSLPPYFSRQYGRVVRKIIGEVIVTRK